MLTVLLITRLVLRRVFELFRIGLRTNCALSENLASAPIKSEPIGKDGGARFGERGVNPFATAECGDFTAASSGEVEHDEPDSCSFSETSSQLSGNVTSGEILRRRRRKPLKKTKAGNKLRRRDCGRTSLGRPGSRGKLAPLISDCESTRRSRPRMDQEAFNARQARKSICERSRMIGFQDGTEMTTAGHQKKVEDDMQQQTLVEYCVWGEGYQRLDEIMAGFHRRYEHEVADLQSAMKRLEKDKDRLQNSLIRSQIKISYLQVEMEALRKRNVYQRLQHEREKNNIKKMLTECHSYYSHMKWLQQNMPESSDWFYSKLYRNAEQSCKREKNVKTVPNNTLKNRSGLSLCTDTVDSSSSECDYEDHKDILECVYQHSSGEGTQRLDNEMSDWKSEHTYLAPSRYDSESLASTRKLLSAFSCQTDSDILDAKESAPIYRLVLAGDVGTGKSSFLLRLSMNEFRSDIQMTLGVDMHIKMMLVDGEKTHLQIWDTAGQERFCSISQSYFRKAHGVLLLYDVTSKASFFNIREWMDQIKESTDEALSMCVIGNKADLRAELPEDSCVSSAHGEKLATIYNALFCETSAKEGTNVVEAVLHLAREIKKSASLRPTSPLDLQMEQMDGKVLWQ